MGTACPNTQLAQLTSSGPWHLLHSVPDMVALVRLVTSAAACAADRTPGTIAGECPPRVALAPKGRPDPLMRACHAAAVATAAERESAETAHPCELAYIRTAIADAEDGHDIFTLRWFTFVVMYMCPAIVDKLSCAAPTPVVDRFLAPFKITMANHLFGKCQRSKAKATAARIDPHEHVVSTPLELVATFMIHLQASYFAQTADNAVTVTVAP
jgi:hypothetical protein